MKLQILTTFLISDFFISCSNPTENPVSDKETTVSKAVPLIVKNEQIIQNSGETELTGYDELSNENDYDSFTVSEYNTDLEDIPNIKRPAKSSIQNFKFSKEKLFGIWVQDPGPEVPHATFQITKESFLMVDYDGDGEMPYEINNDSLVVYFNDFIKRGRILDAGNSGNLIIHWNGSQKPTAYYVWKN
jgi:hypothetical protein